MHSSVMEFFRRNASPAEFKGKDVLEVGSYNVNGGLREEIVKGFKPHSYLGIDMRPGPGVDAVMQADQVGSAYRSAFDAVICTEMLEHAEDWRGAVISMKDAMRLGGVIYLTARGPGFPLHDYPGDYWRFTVENMREIFRDFDIAVCEPDYDPRSSGVFLKAKKPITGRALATLQGIFVRPVR